MRDVARRKKRKVESANVALGDRGNTAVDVRVDAFVPVNGSTSEVPQQAHTGMDLGRPISSVLPYRDRTYRTSRGNSRFTEKHG